MMTVLAAAYQFSDRRILRERAVCLESFGLSPTACFPYTWKIGTPVGCHVL